MNPNKKIKILIVNPSADLGGGNTISNNLAMGLDKNIFEVFSFFPINGPASEIICNNVKIFYPSKNSFHSIIKSLKKLVKQNKINIVHAQGTRAAFWVRVAFLSSSNRPKIIYTLHGLHIAHRPFFQKYPLLWLEKISNKFIDKLICPSLSVKSLVEKYKIIKNSKIKLIYNGIDIQNFYITSPSNKKFLKISENYSVISAIQRLNFPKDVSTILLAFKIIKNNFKNVILLIVGSGPLLKKLQEEAKKIGIFENVLFLGDRQDIPEILSISDIVILSSSFEALGLSLLEAMAAKKPVIGTNVEGIKEIIKNGENGFLVEFGNEEKMAESILLLLNNLKLRQKMGENGFKFVSENFSKEKMIKEYQNLYLSL